ncbi:TonB-dependent receptor (plasmid) [Acinetobacter sp. NCu2D-2]|uniref:TonB-dependent siderophore receptor n=1 Tax=Acinetobacter sp. NCu2D-2 TaxID=1608473 RepID=UPI0007CDC63E|nr:TonB-dependent siderophore receptor [Acinetobacter sp. NCu2D-2]ANF83343.1 TonB-dependent receptor [Acinetobacter sp. NCu2D-2]
MNMHRFQYTTLNLALKAALISPVLLSTAIHAADNVPQLEKIVVQAEALYKPTNINLSGFGTEDIQKTPASISVVSSELMQDQHARVLSDVVKNEAAIGDAYAPIGYYPNLISRGFGLDLASSYLINGNTVRGEQNIALENKEQVEILKGISAIQSGMSTPGGVVNYVTKRPQDIQTLTLAANQHGQFSVAADVGGFSGQNDQLGYRINVANEQLNSYVDHVDGERYFASLALDWQLDDVSKLEFDIEAQRFEQRSVPGYQLLDGKVPEHVKWDRLLGYQSWGKPVSTDSLNASIKYNYAINQDWNAAVTASHSKSVLDDYSIFPFGYYTSGCEEKVNCGMFGPNGEYDIYDYKNPDDTYETNQLKINLNGNYLTGSIVHGVNLEVSQTNKSRHRHKGVNKYITEDDYLGNIYEDTYDRQQEFGDVEHYFKAIDSKQFAINLHDHIKWNSKWSTLLGFKWIDLDEETHNKKREKERDTELNKWLPQLAVTYSPTDSTMLYASYAKGLSDGRSAPWFTKNKGSTLLPIHSTQYELGLKQQINQFLFTAAVFDLRQDNQFTKPIDGELYFVEEGKQHNIGLELGLNGALSPDLSIASSFALTKSQLEDVNAPAYSNHQAQNVPKVRLATQLAYQVPAIDGLSLLAAGRYSSSKFANKEATAKVDAYTVFDLGAHYQFKLHQNDAQLRFNIENIFNEKYWRDVGDADGDNYLFLGAPRTATLSLTMNF